MSKILSFFTFNVRSCRENIARFVAFLSDVMFSHTVILFVETWLTESTDYTFDVESYRQVNVKRDNMGWGVKVFYDELPSECWGFPSIDLVNDIFMEIITFFLIGPSIKDLNCKVVVYHSLDWFLKLL